MSEPVSRVVDVESLVVVFVQKTVSERMTEDVGVNVVWVTASERTCLVVLVRLYVGLTGDSRDDVADAAGRHLIGFAAGEEVGAVLPPRVEVGIQRADGAKRVVDVQLEVM